MKSEFWEAWFTRQERIALGFLCCVGLAGLLLLSWRGNGPWIHWSPMVSLLQVRVNSATAPELASLPGIGPKLAQRILDDRKMHGQYLVLADLRRVRGISPKTLDRLKGLVRFD